MQPGGCARGFDEPGSGSRRTRGSSRTVAAPGGSDAALEASLLASGTSRCDAAASPVLVNV